MNEGARAQQSDLQWFIVGRWQEFEGISRANLLRVIAVAGFYLVQVMHFVWFSDGSPLEQSFHREVTLIAVAWLLLSLAVLLALQRRFFPPLLKHAVVIADLLLLTAACSIGNGTSSPLVVVYFLLIAMGAVCFSISLLWTSTLGAVLGYLSLVGMKDSNWFDANHATPVVNQLVVLLSLGLTGMVLGQVVCRVRWMAGQYARRLAALQSSGSKP